jgi:hypothetical protein
MTPAEQEAQRQAQAFMRIYNPLQIQSGSRLSGSLAQGGMCMRDGSNVSFEFLNADFALDDPLAVAYLNRLMSAGAGTQTSVAQNRTALPDWLQQWQDATGSTAPPGSVDRTWGEFLGGTIGPGNVLASVAGAVQGGALSAKQAVTQAQMERAAALITERGAKGVQINPNVRIYDANAVERSKMRARKLTPGKHLMKPRLRIKIEGVTAKVLRVGGMSASAASGGMRGGAGYSTVMASRAASISASQWASGNALRVLRAPGVPAALAFGPSAMLDAADAYEYNAGGQGHMNWRKYGVLSAKSQSANAVGFAVGAAVPTALAVVGFGAAVIGTGGVVLIALGLGIAAQVIFNAAGGGDAAGKLADEVLPK